MNERKISFEPVSGENQIMTKWVSILFMQATTCFMHCLLLEMIARVLICMRGLKLRSLSSFHSHFLACNDREK